MSLTRRLQPERTHRFPRVSGDEPRQAARVRSHREFSPRERG